MLDISKSIKMILSFFISFFCGHLVELPFFIKIFHIPNTLCLLLSQNQPILNPFKTTIEFEYSRNQQVSFNFQQLQLFSMHDCHGFQFSETYWLVFSFMYYRKKTTPVYYHSLSLFLFPFSNKNGAKQFAFCIIVSCYKQTFSMKNILL